MSLCGFLLACQTAFHEAQIYLQRGRWGGTASGRAGDRGWESAVLGWTECGRTYKQSSSFVFWSILVFTMCFLIFYFLKVRMKVLKTTCQIFGPIGFVVFSHSQKTFGCCSSACELHVVPCGCLSSSLIENGWAGFGGSMRFSVLAQSRCCHWDLLSVSLNIVRACTVVFVHCSSFLLLLSVQRKFFCKSWGGILFLNACTHDLY